MEFNPDRDNARESLGPSFGAIVRWQPTGSSEIVPFFGWSGYREHDEGPIVFLAGPALPPEFEQRKLPGQTWSTWPTTAMTTGCSAASSGSRLDHDAPARSHRAMLRTAVLTKISYDAEASGVAQYYIAAVPRADLRVLLRRAACPEGDHREARAAHGAADCAREGQHRLYGGDDERFIATTVIGVARRSTSRISRPPRATAPGLCSRTRALPMRCSGGASASSGWVCNARGSSAIRSLPRTARRSHRTTRRRCTTRALR
jgi:hypothetical protein